MEGNKLCQGGIHNPSGGLDQTAEAFDTSV